MQTNPDQYTLPLYLWEWDEWPSKKDKCRDDEYIDFEEEDENDTDEVRES